MLHILLLILKIIGIIIAVILGILVLLVCIILFVPVRYEVKAKSEETLKSLKVQGKVTWFFHCIRVSIRYEDQALSYKVRAGFKIIAENEDQTGQEVKKEDSREPEGVYYDEMEKDPQFSEDAAKENKEESGLSEGTEKESQASDEDVQKAETIPVQKEPEVHKRTEKRKKDVRKKNAGICQKIKGLYEKIKCTILSICDKIKMLGEKKDKVVGFLTDEVHKTAFCKVKDELLRLLVRLKPKKAEADIRYGFEDPYRTGQVLAGLGVLYPVMGEHVQIVPDFEHKVLKGSGYIKGNIYVFHLAALLWNVLWSREVRSTYRDIKEFKL